MAQPLVIVESPAKARTISRYLGDEFVVESSIGHVRDLPRNTKDLPPELKKWDCLGVDTDNGFKPYYVVAPEKKDQVRTLKSLLKDASELYLATDEDREGEAIAWHLLEVLNPRVPVKRMVFHEITPEAIRHAIDNTRELDRRLVDAQETRRILDRLVGYKLSPVLWKKVAPNLSAGRVQSVATRIVVERERERMRFRSASYWDLEAVFRLAAAEADRTPFPGTLVEVDGRRLATGRDFSETGQLTRPDAALLDETQATALRDSLDGAAFEVRSVERKPFTRKPSPPFMTSTLQQDAGRKLRMSASTTMALAQRLYENGYITYMRTDSTTLSAAALTAARDQIRERYGDAYLPSAPRTYTKKVKNAQEAHEAIRPAGDSFRTPDQVRSGLNHDELRLYELIWQRTIASQMTDARGESVQVRLGATGSQGQAVLFASSGRTIEFPGFLLAYVEGSDDPAAELGDQDRVLPRMAEGDGAAATELEAKGHDTQPPARFTEASLIKRLEELGVGRPSTYASIITTILGRGYVFKKGTALVPSFTAFAVVTLLEQHFGDIVDYAFTARMEDDLDAIAGGHEEMVPWLSRFYFGSETIAPGMTGPGSDGPQGVAPAGGGDGDDGDGDGDGGNDAPDTLGELHGFKALVTDLGDIDARAINSIPIGEDPDGNPVVVRVGRYGPFVQRGDDTASIPDDQAPDELTVERALELLSVPREGRNLGQHPDTGLDVFVKNGRFGPYVQMGEHDDETGLKPRMESLFSDMEPDTVTLEQAVRLLSLPRIVGTDPATGEEISAQNGRYGPYLRKGTDSRSLDNEQALFTVTLDDALRVYSEPKRRRGQTSQSVLKELGPDPDTQKPIVAKDGRFGIYVTDGETNASLRKGDSVDDLNLDRALELLAERRAKGPATKKKAVRKAAKKPVKKAAAKKAGAKKASTKAAAAKKAAAAATKATMSGAGAAAAAGTAVAASEVSSADGA